MGLMPSPAKGTVGPNLEKLMHTTKLASMLEADDKLLSCVVGRF